MDEAPGSPERHDPLPAQPLVDCCGSVTGPELQAAQCAWVGGGNTPPLPASQQPKPL
jgi:hypothetical protein